MKNPSALNPKHSENRIWIPKNADRLKTLEKPWAGKYVKVWWFPVRWSHEDGSKIIDGCYRTHTFEWKGWVPELSRYVPEEELLKPSVYQNGGR